MIRIKALNNFVIFEDIIEEEVENESGLKLAEQAQERPRWGTVISVGEGVADYNGRLIPVDTEPGDTIYVAAHGKEPIMVNQLLNLPELVDELGYDNLDEKELEDMVSKGKALNTASILDVFGKVSLESLDFTPFGDFVVIEKIEPPKFQGDILLADAQRKLAAFGRVLKLGLGWRTADGYENTFQCKEGDIIYYLPHATQIVDYATIGHNKKLHLIKHGNILGVLEKKNESV